MGARNTQLAQLVRRERHMQRSSILVQDSPQLRLDWEAIDSDLVSRRPANSETKLAPQWEGSPSLTFHAKVQGPRSHEAVPGRETQREKERLCRRKQYTAQFVNPLDSGSA